MNYTYILECSDGSFYTGWTNNLEKRINCHNKGKGAKYTRGRLPLKLVYFEEFIENLTRNDKLNLIKDFNLLNLERS